MPNTTTVQLSLGLFAYGFETVRINALSPHLLHRYNNLKKQTTNNFFFQSPLLQVDSSHVDILRRWNVMVDRSIDERITNKRNLNDQTI